MGTLVSSAINLDILTRLYAVATNSPHSSVRSSLLNAAAQLVSPVAGRSSELWDRRAGRQREPA